MKRISAIILTLTILCGLFAFSAVAESASADVYMTFSDNTGKIILAQEKITVTDKNGDGKLNIDEALFAAHEAKYDGGAASGYSTETGTYWLYITKLWGDTSGNFGYYVNNNMSMGLTDEVKSGDYINAYVYQVYEYDPLTYEMTADSYAFFDKQSASVNVGDSISLVLKAVEFDVEFNPVNVPVAGVVITVNGTGTDYVTDEQGKVTVSFDKAGEYLISAKKADAILVPPVTKVTVAEKAQTSNTVTGDETAKSPETSDDITIILCLCLVFGPAAVYTAKKAYEK